MNFNKKLLKAITVGFAIILQTATIHIEKKKRIGEFTLHKTNPEAVPVSTVIFFSLYIFAKSSFFCNDHELPFISDHEVEHIGDR